MRKNILLFLAVLVLFVPTLINLQEWLHQKRSLENKMVFRLPVKGYDPRDFSRGRYASLRIDWKPDTKDPSCFEGYACGFCLIRQAAEKTHIALMRGDMLETGKCNQKIFPVTVYPPRLPLVRDPPSGEIQYAVKQNEPLRFYIDETVADKTDKALRDDKHSFSADAVFNEQGLPILKELYIDGIPYRTFIQAR